MGGETAEVGDAVVDRHLRHGCPFVADGSQRLVNGIETEGLEEIAGTLVEGLPERFGLFHVVHRGERRGLEEPQTQPAKRRRGRVGRIAPVAQYPPNGYGLFDMAGNVWSGAEIGMIPTPTRKPRRAK